MFCLCFLSLAPTFLSLFLRRRNFCRYFFGGLSVSDCRMAGYGQVWMLIYLFFRSSMFCRTNASCCLGNLLRCCKCFCWLIWQIILSWYYVLSYTILLSWHYVYILSYTILYHTDIIFVGFRSCWVEVQYQEFIWSDYDITWRCLHPLSSVTRSVRYQTLGKFTNVTDTYGSRTCRLEEPRDH